jgi:hypothetical protein
MKDDGTNPIRAPKRNFFFDTVWALVALSNTARKLSSALLVSPKKYQIHEFI